MPYSLFHTAKCVQIGHEIALNNHVHSKILLTFAVIELLGYFNICVKSIILLSRYQSIIILFSFGMLVIQYKNYTIKRIRKKETKKQFIKLLLTVR